MRHRYACPLRWADLDLLGHVNNVRYADYLQEARLDFFRALRPELDPAADVAEGLVVVRHELTFRAPLHFGKEPVQAEVWVSELRAGSLTLEYELFLEHDGVRTVYLRARSRMAPFRFDLQQPRRLSAEERALLAPYLEEGAPTGTAEPVTVRPAPERRYPVQVRFSDLDIYRHANNVAYVEYFQEARIAFFERLLHELPDTARLRWVVAQTDIDYRTPLMLRAQPYDCHTRVVRVGNKSLTVDSVIRDGDTVAATARVTLVVFDPETQRATEPPPGYREVLLGMVEPD